ncbi:MAG: DNA gyrase subunit A [Chloroflexota bacterium]
MERGNIQQIAIEQEMRRSYLDYAMSVIVQRALPDARDGLKPVQRRILFGMHDMGVRSNGRYRKGAGIVGEVLKSFHPHSDQAVYDALVRMAQDFSLRYPLIDGQGNYGSVDGDGAAAMRYTEARLAPIADELLADIGKNTVNFRPNYDESAHEPIVLPAKLPNLLINGAAGIAVGMATNIPPHNINEICDGLIHLIDNPDATVEDLMQFVEGPDFPTGGLILGREGIASAYATGRGRVVMRAKAHIDESDRPGYYAIIVTELPYQVNKAAMIEKIADQVRAGRLQGIHDLRDESDRSGMRVVIDLKRDAQPKKVLNNLFKFTAMQQTFGVNMVALADGEQPRVLPLKRAMQIYIDHRQEVITRRTEFDLERAKRRAHVLEGLVIALDNLDAVIQTIRNSDTSDEARTSLMTNFDLTEVQATAILDMQLRRLAALERQRIEEEYAALMEEIAYLEDLLAHPEKILGLVKEDLFYLKEEYGDARRTRIIEATGDLNDEDLIPEVDVVVTITQRGYVKRIPDEAYRTQRRGGRGVTGLKMSDQDDIQHIVATNTHDSLLFFTSRGRVYQLKVHELPDAGRTAKGMPVVNLISLQPDEVVTALMPVRDFTEGGYLFFCTRKGRVKRTTIDQFSSVRSTGLIAISLDDDDELAWVRMTSGNGEIILATRQGKAIRFPEDDVRAMGRTAAGVIGIRLAKNDWVVGVGVITEECLDHELLTVSTRGLGKRTKLSEFRAQGRGSQGVLAMKLPKGAEIAGASIVSEKMDVVLISSAGVVIRIPASQISVIGRATQGVSVMRLEKGVEVVSLAVIGENGTKQAVLDELTAGDIESPSSNGREQ